MKSPINQCSEGRFGCRYGGRQTLIGGVEFAQLRVFARGYIAPAGSDSAPPGPRSLELTVAKSFLRWGEDFPLHVGGEFSAAILDQGSNSVIIAHDLFGLIDMFYCELGHSFVFGSDLNEVLRLSGSCDFDNDYFAEFVRFGAVLGRRTPYRQISRLLAGETARIEPGQPARVRSHLPSFVGRFVTYPERKRGDLSEEFRQQLSDAARVATTGADRISAELSGGLDSSSIVSMICNRGKSLPTISIVSPSKPKYNEQRWIESVIEKYKCDGTFIDGDLFKPFASFPNNLAEPSNLIIGDALHSAVAAAAIANGTRVLLSGLGGDQVCYGDHPRPFHLADLALRGRWLSLAKELRAQSNADPSRRAIAFYLKHDVVRTIGNFLGRRPLEGSQDPGLAPWATSMLRQITAIERKTQYPKLSRYVSVQGYLERVLSVGRLASQQKAYRSSIEMRFPMFYAPLVALMSSLPHELRFNPSEDRLLQRLALKGILPELVRTRRIQGGSENLLFEALRADRDLYDLVREGRHVGRLGLVDLDAWRIWVSRARFGQVFHLTQFFSVVALELWLDHRNWANLKAEPTS